MKDPKDMNPRKIKQGKIRRIIYEKRCKDNLYQDLNFSIHLII